MFEPVVAPPDAWEKAPVSVGIMELFVGFLVLIESTTPDDLGSGRSTIHWSGGVLGAKPPPDSSLTWNPMSLVLAAGCLVSLSIVVNCLAYVVRSAASLALFPTAALAGIHLYVVAELWRATKRILNIAPS